MPQLILIAGFAAVHEPHPTVLTGRPASPKLWATGPARGP